MFNILVFYYPNSQIGFVTCIVHVTFVFMVTILLINFLIAILCSSYDHMMRYREVLFQMQCFSVSVAIDQMFVRLLAPFSKFLRRRLFVHENGRYYVTRVVAVTTDQTKCIWCVFRKQYLHVCICYHKKFKWSSVHCCYFCNKVNIWNVTLNLRFMPNALTRHLLAHVPEYWFWRYRYFSAHCCYMYTLGNKCCYTPVVSDFCNAHRINVTGYYSNIFASVWLMVFVTHDWSNVEYAIFELEWWPFSAEACVLCDCSRATFWVLHLDDVFLEEKGNDYADT